MTTIRATGRPPADLPSLRTAVTPDDLLAAAKAIRKAVDRRRGEAVLPSGLAMLLADTLERLAGQIIDERILGLQVFEACTAAAREVAEANGIHLAAAIAIEKNIAQRRARWLSQYGEQAPNCGAGQPQRHAG